MKYRVTALTPVLVGDGQELAPIDYMVWKDQVNVLDQTRIFKLLARGPRLEGYLGQIRKATKLDFASWGGFAQNFSERRIPFEDPGLTSIWNSAPPESLFIPTFAADHRGPYLPGSALKGALRTGVVARGWTEKTMERIAASLEGDRLPRRVAEAAEASSGASQVKVVAVADSAPVQASTFKIFLTRVASLDTRQAGASQLVWKVAGRGSVPRQRMGDSTPVFAEMAVPGTAFEGEWQARSSVELREGAGKPGDRSEATPSAVVDAANRHAQAQLTIHERYAEIAGLQGLQQTIARLQGELRAAQETSSGCLLCLGWGSGFISKAGFLETDDEAYRKVLRSVPSFGRSIREGVPFPKTRRVIFTGGQPATLPGWVKLELHQ